MEITEGRDAGVLVEEGGHGPGFSKSPPGSFFLNTLRFRGLLPGESKSQAEKILDSRAGLGASSSGHPVTLLTTSEHSRCGQATRPLLSWSHPPSPLLPVWFPGPFISSLVDSTQNLPSFCAPKPRSALFLRVAYEPSPACPWLSFGLSNAWQESKLVANIKRIGLFPMHFRVASF